MRTWVVSTRFVMKVSKRKVWPVRSSTPSVAASASATVAGSRPKRIWVTSVASSVRQLTLKVDSAASPMPTWMWSGVGASPKVSPPIPGSMTSGVLTSWLHPSGT